MFARHDLVWLSEAGWQSVLETAADGDRHAMDAWWRADWPLIARRHEPGTAPDQVCLGLAMPPDPASGNKHRIALSVASAQVKKILPPLKIDAVLPAVGQGWSASLAQLQADARARALPLRVYGSCALQALTGKPYLTPASDIDLLLYPQSAGQLRDGIAMLELHSAELPLDGEIVFPSGQAVAWKEWRNAGQQMTSRVLVKQLHRVTLLPMRDLLASFEEHACLG